MATIFRKTSLAVSIFAPSIQRDALSQNALTSCTPKNWQNEPKSDLIKNSVLGGDLEAVPRPGRSLYGTLIAQHVAFAGCGNTRENTTRAEAKDISIISQAKVVKAGVVRLMELQERGWSYLRP
jgi:intracellular sulfur oxidation DsrE/DsrF family protein